MSHAERRAEREEAGEEDSEEDESRNTGGNPVVVSAVTMVDAPEGDPGANIIGVEVQVFEEREWT